MFKTKFLILSVVILFSLISVSQAMALEIDDLKGVLDENTLKSILSSDVGDFLKKGSDFIKEKAEDALNNKIKGDDGSINSTSTVDIATTSPEYLPPKTDQPQAEKKIDFMSLLERLFEWFYSILKYLFNLIVGLLSKT